MIERMAENDALVTRFLDDGDFQEIASDVLAREIFEEIGHSAGETLEVPDR